MIPREKKPGECDCDWSGSCDEHAFVPPGARRLIEARAHAAGYEAAVRDFWRGVCEQKAVWWDRESLAKRRPDAGPLERAKQHRAWAKEGA